MAILHSSRPATSMAPAAARSAEPDKRRKRREKALEVAPMVLMGALAAVSVGYGFGTMMQFDQDWRSGVPVALASEVGTPATGASLDEAVTAILADSPAPVTHVVCTSMPAEPLLADHLCVADAADGKVNVVARQDRGLLRVTVFTVG